MNLMNTLQGTSPYPTKWENLNIIHNSSLCRLVPGGDVIVSLEGYIQLYYDPQKISKSKFSFFYEYIHPYLPPWDWYMYIYLSIRHNHLHGSRYIYHSSTMEDFGMILPISIPNPTGFGLRPLRDLPTTILTTNLFFTSVKNRLDWLDW